MILYSTWGCHLCEEAEALLQQSQHPFTVVDIVDEPEAFERYRISIPVVYAAGRELYWPFDAVALNAFIKDLPSAE